jgi:hypothetical protein
VRVPRPFAPGAPNGRTLFDMMPNGKFLGLIPEGQSTATPNLNTSSQINVVLNWAEELQSRVPSTK